VNIRRINILGHFSSQILPNLKQFPGTFYPYWSRAITAVPLYPSVLPWLYAFLHLPTREHYLYFGILQHIVDLFQFLFRLDGFNYNLTKISTTFQRASRAEHTKCFITADLKVIGRRIWKSFVIDTSHSYEESVEMISNKPYYSAVIRFQQSTNYLEHPVPSFGTRATERRIVVCRGGNPSNAVRKFLVLSCGGELLSWCCGRWWSCCTYPGWYKSEHGALVVW
jgi:hypothetical protein